MDRQAVTAHMVSEEREAEFSFDALIGDIDEPDTLQIEEALLVNGSADIDFGEIEMDRGEG